MPQISYTTWCQIQTFEFLKIRDVKRGKPGRRQEKSKLVASLPGGKVTVNLIERVL